MDNILTKILGGISGLLPDALPTTWVFILVALLLVIVFTDSGPKKIFALLAGIGLLFLTSKGRQKYLIKKMRKVNEAFKEVQNSTAERNLMIEKNNSIISDLESQMADLQPGIEADKAQLKQLEFKIAASRDDYDNTLLESEAKAAIALDMAEKEADKLPFSTVADQIRAKYGLPTSAGVSPQSSPPVTDPALPKKNNGSIVIDGFTMKGDVA